ncbi:valyl-tRNA synthetase [Alicyclobacillus hesperidum URH17-3-68]|nr:valyl-tRNA synthetase [Alicyclobacillus hesperidum URH17-3-68]
MEVFAGLYPAGAEPLKGTHDTGVIQNAKASRFAERHGNTAN